jgi:hypothetical protein
MVGEKFIENREKRIENRDKEFGLAKVLNLNQKDNFCIPKLLFQISSQISPLFSLFSTLCSLLFPIKKKRPAVTDRPTPINNPVLLLNFKFLFQCLNFLSLAFKFDLIDNVISVLELQIQIDFKYTFRAAISTESVDGVVSASLMIERESSWWM